MVRGFALTLSLILGLAPLGCGQEADSPPPVPGTRSVAPAKPEAKTPDSLDHGLLLALAAFRVGADGKVQMEPQPAQLDILARRDGEWKVTTIKDPESNVFHKAMVYQPPGEAPGILTLGGTAAALKLRRGADDVETLWTEDFGGKFSRMRDAEIGDLYGDGRPSVAVATHDQGVVAVVRPVDGAFEVERLDSEENTFVHEIEIGDLDSDGILEVYATPSEPNRLDGSPQSGKVVRYVPAKGEGRVVVADLGSRHAKEILVADIAGDGTDELYVSVEGKVSGRGAAAQIVQPVEIRRYDAGTDPKGGTLIATLQDHLCRFLTVGDIDGDGRKEMVAAAYSSGLWLMRPGSDPDAQWTVTSIDRNSSGFEHAAILADLDTDGRDELYVASDNQGEVRRYTWNGRSFDKEVIYERVPGSVFTWNIMPVPVELIR